MKVFWRLVPVALIELIARLAGYAVGVISPHGAYKVERIGVRGRYWARRLSGSDLRIGRSVQLEGDRISLGARVRLYDGSHYVTGGRGWITIGDDTHISRLSVVSGLGGVTIGKGCAISAHVAIYSVTADTSAAEVAFAEGITKPVSIGDNVYMGVGVKVIPGVSIGDGAVIAAGAVVTRDIPTGVVAKGVPATYSTLKKRTATSTTAALEPRTRVMPEACACHPRSRFVRTAGEVRRRPLTPDQRPPSQRRCLIAPRTDRITMFQGRHPQWGVSAV